MADKKISQFQAIVTPDDADVLPVNDVSEGDPSLINKKMTLQQFVTFIGKINQAVGYTLAGGTTSKTLTVSEDSTINQNLSTTSAVDFKRSVIHNTDSGNTCLSLENDFFQPAITFLYSGTGGVYPFKMNGNASQFINMTGFRGGNQVLEFEFDGDVAGGVVWYNGFDNSDITFQINGNLKDYAGSNVARLDFSGKTLVGLPNTAGKVAPASMRNSQIHFYLDEAGDVLHFQTKDSGGVAQDYQLSIGAGDVTSVFSRSGDVVAVSGDYNTDLVTEATNQYFTNARALTAVEKTNQATGFTIDGGTISKTLTVTENSTIDQNLATTAGPSFANLSVPFAGTMNDNSGVSFYSLNPDYKIGFDNQAGSVGYLRYNIDIADTLHYHAWSAGDISNPINLLMRLRGDGLLALGSHTPESRIDSGADIRVAEIATPSNPSSGMKIYAKSDNKLYALNDAGTEFDLTAGGTVDTTKLTLDHNNAPGTPAAGKVTLFAKTDDDFWQIDSSGASRNLAVDQEDGIVSTAVTYQALITDTLIKVDATLATTIQLDAATLGRQPVTITREVGLGTSLAIAGINGTTLRGGVASVANSLYASVTYIKMSSNEMLQIANN